MVLLCGAALKRADKMGGLEGFVVIDNLFSLVFVLHLVGLIDTSLCV